MATYNIELTDDQVKEIAVCLSTEATLHAIKGDDYSGDIATRIYRTLDQFIREVLVTATPELSDKLVDGMSAVELTLSPLGIDTSGGDVFAPQYGITELEG